MPDPASHAEDRNIIERILLFIPGFRGYLGKEYRRESDHLARTWLANRLQRSKRGLDDYMRRMVEAGQIDALPQCERLKTNLDRVIARFEGDVRGYSGFFDYVKVREDLLDAVYDHDMSMMADVEKLTAAIEELTARYDKPVTAIGDLLDQLNAVERKYDQRGDMLNGLGG